MNFLIDVHLPISLSKFIDKRVDCSSIHVNQVLQKWNTPDDIICKYADENDLIVVTKDADFKNSHFVNKTPKKLIRIVLGNTSNKDLCEVFEKFLPIISLQATKNIFYFEIGNEQISIIE